MIKENQRVRNQIKAVIDAGLMGISFFLAYQLRFLNYEQGDYLPWSDYVGLILFIIPVSLFLYSLFGLYGPPRTVDWIQTSAYILLVNSISMTLLLSLLFLLKQMDYSRRVLFLFLVFNSLFTLASRYLLEGIFLSFRRKKDQWKRVLVLGTGDLGQEYVKKVRGHQDFGYQVVGFLDNRVEAKGVLDLPVLGKLDALEELIEAHVIHAVIVALSMKEYDELEQIIYQCEKGGVKLFIIPDYLKYIPARPYLDDLDGLPLINLRTIPLDQLANRMLKRMMDLILSLTLLFVLSPLLFFIALSIRITSPGPVLFKQERMGLNRRPFTMYKFRSMVTQPSSQEEKAWTTRDDPRMTLVGRILRKTSLDELPQLFNVLLGEMSLIGPRPERPYFVETFKEQVPKYMMKHQVRPGMTGWAQVNGWRGDTSIKERIKHDLYYIENWSFHLDVKIIFLTLYQGLMNKNAY